MRRSKKKSNGRIFLLNDFYAGGSDLLLYDGYEEKYQTFGSFLECGVKNNELCGYAYPNETEKVSFGNFLGKHAGDIRGMPITNGHIRNVRADDIALLGDRIDELRKAASEENAPFRVQMDFGTTPNSRNLEAILELVDTIQEAKEAPTSTLSAFNISLLNQDIVNKLVKIHDRVILSTKGGTSVSFSQFSKNDDLALPSIDVISSDSMEHCIKKSLDVIVLSLLQQRPMCGFDIIKTIVQNFSVLLSQGTVYPILYSLKEDGYVDVVMRPDNKTRVYVPTETGRKFMDDRIKEYLLAQGNIISLVGKGLEDYPFAPV